MGSLDGKVAVVTGAGQGIGRAEAHLLAREGARVVVNDLGCTWQGEGESRMAADQVAEEIRKAGGQAVPNYDDVSKFDSAKRIIATALQTWGRLDILVNNAGILRDKMIFHMEETDFDSVIGVHLKGTFGLTRHACAHFRDRHKQGDESGGRIINTTSIVALRGNAGQANYIAAKGGIAALTLATSLDMKKYGVTCNAISPGARTRLIAQTQEAKGGSAEKRMPRAGEFDPFDPANIAPLAAFLASDQARGITGRVFHIVGGKIDLYQGWTPVKSIEKKGRWEVGELKERIRELTG
ncbi:MAG: SDR family oxidoreductase [Euryarchaeota archaeon]|nr:SDR family oxidoreductase [Euryarchaeota archaeon]